MLSKINISFKKQKLVAYLVLIIVTFAVFWQVNQYDFINFDDHVYVTQNSHIQSGITLEGFYWALSTEYFGLWNPLVWISFMLDYQLFGLNAGGYHLTNLIFHILCTLLLFWLFNRMTGAIWKSAFVAAFFALHPLHVESVAWIAERKDVLSAFFWMLTLCFYVYYTERSVIRRYLLVLLAFVFALMSKPMVVTLPIVMILLDYWPLKRFELKQSNLILWQLREKTPFFILSAVLVIVTLYSPNSSSSQLYPLGDRIANASVSFVTYLEKTFWPHDLAVFYPFPAQILIWQVIGSSLLILSITVIVIVMIKRLPYFFTGWMWYAITIAPVIGIIQIGNYAMADRYHYLPSIGVAIMLVWGIPSLIKNVQIRRKTLFPAGMFLIVIMAVLAWKQCGYWENSATLFNYTLQVTKDNYLAHNSLGLAMFAEGKTNEAIDHFNKAIRIRPGFFRPYHNRGAVYASLGQYQRAIDDYNEAIRLSPNFAEIYNNRGIAYSLVGKQQRAIVDYNYAIHLKPDYFEAYNNRGNAYSELGQKERSIEEFNKCISLKPDYSLFYANRATVYFYQDKNQQGCLDAKKACELGDCRSLENAKVSGHCH